MTPVPGQRGLPVGLRAGDGVPLDARLLLEFEREETGGWMGRGK